MSIPEELQKINRLAFEVTHGDINAVDLKCPYCAGRLIFSFTRIREGRFGLFIDCEDCHRRHHFSLSQKPPNFREDLVLKEYQDMENAILGSNSDQKGEPH